MPLTLAWATVAIDWYMKPICDMAFSISLNARFSPVL